MAIETICTGCGQKLSVADENAGKRARCPACGQIYTIPSTSDAPLGGTPRSDTRSNPTSPTSAASAYDAGRDADQPPDGVRYWMRSVDGGEYGPVDQPTLDRWFREGRVGPGYQIRQSEFGNWQAADIFRPRMQVDDSSGGTNTSNPYSPVDTSSGMYRYPKADQGVLILVMGILGFMCCPIFGIVAWVMGHTALNDIKAGRADPKSKGLVQAGYYIGIAGVVMNILCVGGSMVMQALMAVGGAG